MIPVVSVQEFQLIVLYFERKHKVRIVQVDKTRISFVSKNTKVLSAKELCSNLLCSRLQVLLVEDNDFTAELLTSMMQERRMVVERARNGTEALEMVGVVGSPGSSVAEHAKEYDVVIMVRLYVTNDRFHVSC